eukprot:3935167-Rhodomonas_salina.8
MDGTAHNVTFEAYGNPLLSHAMSGTEMLYAATSWVKMAPVAQGYGYVVVGQVAGYQPTRLLRCVQY